MSDSPIVAFQREIFLPFHWADPAGILFFNHVFTIAHDTYEQWIIEKLKIPWHAWFSRADRGFPLHKVSATYHKPLVVGQLCHIELFVSEIRTSSFLLHCALYQNQTLACVVETLHVHCNKITLQKRPLPAALKQALNVFHNDSTVL